MRIKNLFAATVARASACRVEICLDGRRKRRDQSRRGRHECPRHGFRHRSPRKSCRL